MWIPQILSVIIGLSAGMLVAAGLFSFITGLGVISDFADRTHTGEHVMLYEDAIVVGGILGNLLFVFKIHVPGVGWILPIFGLLAGIFTGCWAMALAEMLEVFPIFVRRMKLVQCIPWVILGTALGKTAGALLFFSRHWGK